MLFNLLRWLDSSPAHYWLVRLERVRTLRGISPSFFFIGSLPCVPAKFDFVQRRDARRAAGVSVAGLARQSAVSGSGRKSVHSRRDNVAKNYRLVGDLDGSRVYVRNDRL